MKINWFPGHMTKALRMMSENVAACDIIGYVLDARACFSSFNPAFDKLFEHKPVLFILNKCDLADDEKTQRRLNWFKEKNLPCVALSACEKNDVARLKKAFLALAQPKLEKNKKRGISLPVRVMIVGVPNCGKSTLINALAGRKSAQTGNTPGVTRGKQWVAMSGNVQLLDTPGTCWSNYKDEKVAQRLCFVGSIKRDIFDIYEVAVLLAEELKQNYPDNLKQRYGIQPEGDGAEILAAVCVSRGLISKGGENDLLRGATTLFNDFQSGKLGKVSFD